MAKNKRHIDLELKDKLIAHEASVMESDWTAFETFRAKKESKRRRFIYLIAAALVFIMVSGMLVWKFQESKRLDQSGTEEIAQTPQATEDRTDTPQNTESIASQSDPQSQEKTTPEQTQNSPGQSPQETAKDPAKSDSEQTSSENVKQGSPEKTVDGKGGVVPEPKETRIQRYASIPMANLPSLSIRIPAPLWNWAEMPTVIAYESSKEEDSTKLPGGKKASFIPTVPTPSLAFGLSYGFGNPNLTVGNNDTTQTHRQYEKTLKEAKQKSQVFRLFLQYEYRMKLGFEFGAGLQFSSQTHVQQYNFEMREIPWLGMNGEILFYVNVPPGQAVTPTIFESRQNTYSASVPLSFGYARNFGPNFRLGLRAQGSFGMNWSKDFKGLSPKILSETTVRANVNPFKMSYGGGLFGEYFYLDKWSARLSLDWTAQNKLYKNSNSYNITNRYYEFKLALVRYL